MTQIVIISGASASGKTTLARTLAPVLRARVINAGDIVLATVLANGLAPHSRADAGRIFLEAFGEEALGPLLERRVMLFERVIIDGLRLPAAHDLIRGRATSTFHIHLQVSNDVRRERLKLRDGHADTDLIADGYAPWMKRRADLVVANEREDGWPTATCSHHICHRPVPLDVNARFVVEPKYPSHNLACLWNADRGPRIKELSAFDFVPQTNVLAVTKAWRSEGDRFCSNRLDQTCQ